MDISIDVFKKKHFNKKYKTRPKFYNGNLIKNVK